jgi:hypothetical protein
LHHEPRYASDSLVPAGQVSFALLLKMNYGVKQFSDLLLGLKYSAQNNGEPQLIGAGFTLLKDANACHYPHLAQIADIELILKSD